MYSKGKLSFVQRLNKDKLRFTRFLQNRFALRLHMGLILLATTLSGVLVSKLFLVLGVRNFLVRYPLAVILVYGVFFLLIKLWLLYVAPGKGRQGNSSGWLDGVDVPTPGGSGASNPASFCGGGGHFSGAGATDSFEAPAVLEMSAPDISMSEGASGAVGGALETVGDAVGEEGGLVVLVTAAVVAVVAAALFGCAAYVIIEAPIILSEAAFEALLTVVLIKKAQEISAGDWVGSIFKTTWKPFALTLGISCAAALVLHDFFPEATRLIDVLR